MAPIKKNRVFMLYIITVYWNQGNVGLCDVQRLPSHSGIK